MLGLLWQSLYLNVQAIVGRRSQFKKDKTFELNVFQRQAHYTKQQRFTLQRNELQASYRANKFMGIWQEVTRSVNRLSM